MANKNIPPTSAQLAETTTALKSLLDSPEYAQATADMQKRSSEILGFWDWECKTPLFFIPQTAKLSDGKADILKSSCLIEGQLTRPCVLVSKDGEPFQGQPGDVVGVWAKPGMREVAFAAGIEVAMAAAGQKDVGKAKPMKVFDVRFGKGGAPLVVTADNRGKSKGAKLPIPVVFPAPIT